MRFRRGESDERSRPVFSCCSVSISISCCSLPAFFGLVLTGLLVWLGLRFGQDEIRKRRSTTGAG
ncbi:MAG: hypothetical protein R3A46_14220 [Thermomicrobiales bacterium]